MSDFIKHECGIALLKLKKPLEYFQEKYGSVLFGINKMYLMMEKQHNRGQDGAGFASIKSDMNPGERFMSRIRSTEQQPIYDIFQKINTTISNEINKNPCLSKNLKLLKKRVPFLGELMLGHVRYGTFGKNSIESVHPFLRQNNWMHRNLIVAGNFNMTNVGKLFSNLVQLGQHPKENSDTITVMENIGHFLDDAVAKIYKNLKKEGFSKFDSSPLIAERLDISKILKKASKDWDGGFTIAGMIGHGDAFVLRDPCGIRPAFYFDNEEFTVVASERPVIQTVFDVKFNSIKEIPPGNAMILKKSDNIDIVKIFRETENKQCSFERIYFSRGSDSDIYKERKKLGYLLFGQIMKSIKDDLKNTVFSYIPNTAETSFYGLISSVQDYLRNKVSSKLSESNFDLIEIQKILELRPRIEKIAIKDVKLRTFITEDNSRNELVNHVYDVTYGIVKPSDNLVILDDSIVRGTTLRESILTMLNRLNPKKIIIVSSAPQIRYPDCYGIDMAKLEDFIAFQAAIKLHEENGTLGILKEIYDLCINSFKNKKAEAENHVKDIYKNFTDDEISNKMSEMLTGKLNNIPLKIIFQKIEGLHNACPNHKGDWYFTGNYPTPGGNRVVNQSFINFFEGKSSRAY